MAYRAGRGWGMPFIVSPNYVPQDLEWERHYKPEQQGCADCNGVRVPPSPPASPKEILTCDGIKTIMSTARPDVPPVYNREMDSQYVGGVNTFYHTRIISRSTRETVSVETLTVKSNQVQS